MAQPTVDNEQLGRDVFEYIVYDDDPYSACVGILALALEAALGDDVNDAMSQREYESLGNVAMRLVDGDPGARIEVDPRGG